MEKFNLPRQVFELVDQLPVAEQGAVYSALFAFVFHDEDRSASLSGMALAVFNLAMLAIKPKVLRARRKVRRVRNEEGGVRSEASLVRSEASLVRSEMASSVRSEDTSSVRSEEGGVRSESTPPAGGAGDVPQGMRRYALVSDRGWQYVDLPADLPAGAAIF